MRVRDRILARLQASFAPEVLEVVDESDRHIGHAGARPEGESHFRVTIRAARFQDMSRIERHRAVHAALGNELTDQIHALSLDIAGS